MRIAIKNGLLIDPAHQIEAPMNLYIEAKQVVGVGQCPDGFVAQREIDANGCWVMPGLIDLCARMRDPGLEHQASIASETKAAAAAGITTLCQPPDTNPITDTAAVIELIHQQSEHHGYARVLPIGALTQQLEGNQLSEMAALKEAGCVALANVFPMRNTQILRRSLEYAATHDLMVFLTPQDYDLSEGGCVHEGAVATRLGLPGIPTAAETMAVGRDLALIEQVGVRAHFYHLSTARAAQMIGRAQYDGHRISCDVAAHQLFLTEMDVNNFDVNCHVLPPLRTERDKEGLRKAVKTNTVSAICSNHEPVDADDKAVPICASLPGISGLSTLLPLTMKLVDENVLTRTEAVARLTAGPASILNIDFGHLGVGAPADVCIYDPELEWQLDARNAISLGFNSPFDQWYFKGRVTHTLHSGRVVFELNGKRA